MEASLSSHRGRRFLLRLTRRVFLELDLLTFGTTLLLVGENRHGLHVELTNISIGTETRMSKHSVGFLYGKCDFYCFISVTYRKNSQIFFGILDAIP